jgi:hypothetical protein
MELITGLFSAFGLSASAGLNAYIPLIIVALVGKFTDLIQLREPFDVLTSWWIIGLLVVLSLIEVFADKVPAVNHINDGIQTFVRPAAGAILFAASANVITEIHPILSMASGLLVSGSVHAVKSTTIRPFVTATTGGVGNLPVSVSEDVISTTTSILAVFVPVILMLLLAIAMVLLLIFLRRRQQRFSMRG